MSAVPPPLTARRFRPEWVLPPVLVVAVALLADGVANDRGLVPIDKEWAEKVRVLNTSPDVPAAWTVVRERMETITYLGDRRFQLGLAGVVGLTLAAARKWRLLLCYGGGLAGNILTVEALKHWLQRPRPPYCIERGLETSYSFPSAHSAGAAAGFGLLAYVLVQRFPHRGMRAVVAAVATCLVLTVGYSRIYLGVHYLGDVLGGFCVGLLWLCLAAVAYEWGTAGPVPPVPPPISPAGGGTGPAA